MFDKFSDDEIVDSGVNRQRVPFFKFGQGKTIFRIMPPHADAKGYWFRRVRRHNLFFSKDQGRLNRSVTCLEDNCPLCEFAEAVFEDGNEAVINFVKKVQPKEEIFVNALIFNAPIEFVLGKVYLLKLPKKEFTQIFGWDRDEQMGWSDITGVRAFNKGEGLRGVKFVMDRTGTTMTNTKYTLSGIPNREDLLVELKKLQVDLNSLELPNMYAPDSSLSVPDASYLNETLEMLKKEFKKATSVFETGVVPNSQSLSDIFKGNQGAIPGLDHNYPAGPDGRGTGAVMPDGVKITPPSQFKFKE